MSSNNKSQMKGVVIGAVIGAVLTFGAYTILAPSNGGGITSGDAIMLMPVAVLMRVKAPSAYRRMS